MRHKIMFTILPFILALATLDVGLMSNNTGLVRHSNGSLSSGYFQVHAFALSVEATD